MLFVVFLGFLWLGFVEPGSSGLEFSSNLQTCQPCFFRHFLWPLILFFWDTNYVNVRRFEVVPHSRIFYLFLLGFFSLCFIWDNFYYRVFMFTNLFSPMLSELLSILSNVFFILHVVIFLSLEVLFVFLYLACFYLTCTIFPLHILL